MGCPLPQAQTRMLKDMLKNKTFLTKIHSFLLRSIMNKYVPEILYIQIDYSN